MFKVSQKIALACLVLALGAALNECFAQAAAPSAGIDLRPLLNEVLLPLASVVATILGTLAIAWVKKRLALEDTAQTRLLGEIADEALKKAVAYARGMGERQVGALSPSVSTGSLVVDNAVRYAIAQIPDTLKRLGYDPTTDEGRAAIERMVRARF